MSDSSDSDSEPPNRRCTELVLLRGQDRHLSISYTQQEGQSHLFLHRDTSDARILRISLSDSCIKHLKAREEKELRFIEALFFGFESQELLCLSKAIAKLEKNVFVMGKQYEEKG